MKTKEEDMSFTEMILDQSIVVFLSLIVLVVIAVKLGLEIHLSF